MKFTLKNCPDSEWKKGFEKEVREEKDWCERCLAEDPLDDYCTKKLKWIKEVLGE